MDNDAVETACAVILADAGIPVWSEVTNLQALVQVVMEGLEDCHLGDIALEWNSWVTEDDWEWEDAQLALTSIIADFLKAEVFAADTLMLYRSIQVTCPLSEVGLAEANRDIGSFWSTKETIEEMDFLYARVQPGERMVTCVAQVSHGDVDWLATIGAHCNPWTSEYARVVPRKTADIVWVGAVDRTENL